MLVPHSQRVGCWSNPRRALQSESSQTQQQAHHGDVRHPGQHQPSPFRDLSSSNARMLRICFALSF
jgi:hypothetical protein